MIMLWKHLKKIDYIFDDAKIKITEKAIKFAIDYKNEEMFYVLASGPCWGVQGIQWLHVT